MITSPSITSAEFQTVDGTTRAVTSSMSSGTLYLFASSANCYIKQGTSKLLTCLAKASLVDGETFTATVEGVSTVFELDVNGTGVTAGRTQVNVSGATTAASVAAIVRTALLATLTYLSVTDNSDGTLTVVAPDRTMTLADTVANVSWTSANAVLPPSAASGSMLVPAGYTVHLEGKRGPQLGVLQVSTGGVCTLTKAMRL